MEVCVIPHSRVAMIEETNMRNTNTDGQLVMDDALDMIAELAAALEMERE